MENIKQLIYQLKEAKAKEEEYRVLEAKYYDLKWKQWNYQLDLKNKIIAIKINELKGREVNEDLIKDLEKINNEEWEKEQGEE